MCLNDLFYILKGLKYTFLFSFIATIFGFCIGFYVGLYRYIHKNLLSKIFFLYSSLFRNTPIIFQLFVFIFILKILNDQFCFAIVLSLNSGAYMSEVFLDSMHSIDIKYIETSMGLGFSKSQAIMYLMFEKVFQNIQKILKNEMISLIKETSVASMIGIGDIFFRAKEIGTIHYDFFSPIIFAGILFLFINKIYEYVLSKYIIKIVKIIVKRFYLF